jgi:hypothetical protein
MRNGTNHKRGAHQGLPSCLTHLYNPPQRPPYRDKGMVTVYYDGACPKCVKDRYNYEKLSGDKGKKVRWFDITGQEERLREIGIDPQKALMELHVKKNKSSNSKIRFENEVDQTFFEKVAF